MPDVTDDRYRSRKWRGFVGLVIAATVLAFLGMIESEHWVAVALSAFGIFAGANATEKIGISYTKSRNHTPD